MDLTLRFLNGSRLDLHKMVGQRQRYKKIERSRQQREKKKKTYTSRAVELSECGEVDGGDDEVDIDEEKERTKQHNMCEMEMRGLGGRVICQAQASVPQEEGGHQNSKRQEEERRGEVEGEEESEQRDTGRGEWNGH